MTNASLAPLLLLFVPLIGAAGAAPVLHTPIPTTVEAAAGGPTLSASTGKQALIALTVPEEWFVQVDLPWTTLPLSGEWHLAARIKPGFHQVPLVATSPQGSIQWAWVLTVEASGNVS